MTKTIVIIGFLVAFAAGLIVGMETRQTTVAAPTTRPSDRRSILTAELNLTTAQQDTMKKIWSEQASRGWHEQEDRRRQFRKERDDAIASLIRSEDKPKFDAAIKKYSDQSAALDRDAREGFEKKVKETNEILTPEQRTKYADFLHRHQWGGRERDTTRRADVGATSSASSQPSLAPRS